MKSSSGSTGSRPRAIRRYSFLVALPDGLLSRAELEMIERLALKDHVVDSEEQRVLSEIFGRLRPDQFAPGVRSEVEEFCSRHGVVLGGPLPPPRPA